MPFVFLFGIFDKLFLQGYLQILLVAGVFYCIYKISLKLKFTFPDSLFLAYAFCFSSAFLGVALLPWSWYFAQVVGVFIFFWILHEFLNKKRYWFMGILLGFLFLTRVTASLIISLFILDILFISKGDVKIKVKNIINLCLPILISVGLVFLYNYLRFGDFFENGYAMQFVPEHAAKARAYGIFSIIHLPANIYYFLLSTPIPVFKDNVSHVLTFPFVKANPWGMSIFTTSPYFIYLFFINFKKKQTRFMLAATLLIASPIFLYYGIGWRQFGYRYSLDFLPILYLILIVGMKEKYKNLPDFFKYSVIVFSFVNLYLFLPFVFR